MAPLPRFFCRMVQLMACLVPLSTLLAAPAEARQLFRCGNQYQDRPCDDGGTQLQVNPKRSSISADRPVARPMGASSAKAAVSTASAPASAASRPALRRPASKPSPGAPAPGG
ncbi:MAG: hypothetical protein IPK34_00930 [Ramlibacter sp.]|nr:hypothetical protein [Ramlibacter sp.]